MMEFVNTGMEAKEALLKGHPKVAIKSDIGKARIDLIPPQFIQAMGSVMTYGAVKYDARNWEGGMEWGRVYAALQRHLNDWWQGHSTDPETGQSHLAHAACCAAMLFKYQQRGIGTDDRHDTPDGR